MSQCVYLCPVNVAKHHHYTLCDKHQQQDCGKLKASADESRQNVAGKTPVIWNTKTSVRTHRGQAAGAFAYRGATADQADDEEQSSHGDDHHGRDESVDILKEVVIVVVRDEYVSADVA